VAKPTASHVASKAGPPKAAKAAHVSPTKAAHVSPAKASHVPPAKATALGRCTHSRGARDDRRGGQSNRYLPHHDALPLFRRCTPQPLGIKPSNSH
jgi:hypothetical protein